MKLIIDIDVTPEEFKKIQVFNIKMMNSKITYKVYEAVQNGIPVSNITNAQIGDAIQTALATYWEEKSKYLTPPPTPIQGKQYTNKLVVIGFSQHDCETHYKCPFCGEQYSSWGIPINKLFACKCGKQVWTG